MNIKQWYIDRDLVHIEINNSSGDDIGREKKEQDKELIVVTYYKFPHKFV